MTLKALAYAGQQQLEAATGQSFKRTHFYEVLAASFGFHSYAALITHAVFAQRPQGSTGTSLSSATVRQRCLDLGYTTGIADQIGSVMAAFLVDSRITVLDLATLVDELRNEFIHVNDDSEECSDEDTWEGLPQDRRITSRDFSDPILHEGLEAAAAKGVALAHYALALMHGPNHNGHSHEVGSAYWYTEAQQGKVLTGAPKEWAEAHAALLARTEKHMSHLHDAARLGEPLAMLDLADEFGDPAFFEQGYSDVDADPAWVASIAQSMGREGDAAKWLTLAAESGDTEAILELIGTYDAGNLMRCWTWLYLAELLDTDLTKDKYYAIHEDGSSYDDDVGGAIYVDGRGGIELEPLDPEQDVLARQAAMGIFSRMQETS